MTEMRICPNAKICPYTDSCNHRKPHKDTSCCKMNPTNKNCKDCIPYVPEFKFGDMVRVLKDNPFSTRLKKGEIVTIKRKRSSGNYRIDKENLTLRPKDFEYIGKEDDMAICSGGGINIKSSGSPGKEKPKYKILKPLTLAELITKSELTRVEVIYVLNWMGRASTSMSPRTTLTEIPGFAEYAKEHECFWDFVIDKGYIEEVQPEVFYKRGDRFRKNDTENILACVGSKRLMLICTDGTHWGDGGTVKDTAKVTQAEFNHIAGSSKEWEKI